LLQFGPINLAPNPKLVEEDRPNMAFASATSDAFFESFMTFPSLIRVDNNDTSRLLR